MGGSVPSRCRSNLGVGFFWLSSQFFSANTHKEVCSEIKEKGVGWDLVVRAHAESLVCGSRSERLSSVRGSSLLDKSILGSGDCLAFHWPGRSLFLLLLPRSLPHHFSLQARCLHRKSAPPPVPAPPPLSSMASMSFVVRKEKNTLVPDFLHDMDPSEHVAALLYPQDAIV